MSMSISEQTVPFEALQRFSKLFVTYVSDFDRLAPFYAFPPADPLAWHRAKDAVLALPRDRHTLVEVLLEQNAAGARDELACRNIEKLLDPAALAVVTGQQVALFGGPMYTLYKTITALKLAAAMEEELSVPVVPVFWLEGEDHDFEEAAAVCLPEGNDLACLRYESHPGDGRVNTGPVGQTPVDGRLDPILDELEKRLPKTRHAGPILELLKSSYAQGSTFREAFMRLMKALLPDTGLVFLSADDVRLKRLAAPLYRKEIEEYDESTARVVEASTRLSSQYHAQVHVRPTNLFLLEQEGRISLEPEDGRFQLRGTDRSFTPDELLELLERSPGRFSPNVVLRPLTQDRLLPTVAYVGGPAEVAYFGQYRGVYEWAGVPMPVIYPRASVTLVEPHVRRTMERYELSLTDFTGDVELLFKRLVLDVMDVDLDRAFDRAATGMNDVMDELQPLAGAIDQTLIRSAEAARQAVLNELDRFRAKLIRAEKRHHEELRSQIDRAHASLFPGGALQERSVSIVYFLVRYGPELVQSLAGRLQLDPSSHQLIDV